MDKKSLIYSDFSKKQLQELKEFYIQTKVDSMSVNELKAFVTEIINHQINNTIGREEEMEAWREMSDFFGEQFEKIALEIQSKFREDLISKEPQKDPQQQRAELLERNSIEKEKKDMWED